MLRFCLQQYMNVENLQFLEDLNIIRWKGKLLLPPIILILSTFFFQAFVRIAELDIPIPAFVASLVLMLYLGIVSTGALVRMFPSALK